MKRNTIENKSKLVFYWLALTLLAMPLLMTAFPQGAGAQSTETHSVRKKDFGNGDKVIVAGNPDEVGSFLRYVNPTRELGPRAIVKFIDGDRTIPVSQLSLAPVAVSLAPSATGTEAYLLFADLNSDVRVSIDDLKDALEKMISLSPNISVDLVIAFPTDPESCHECDPTAMIHRAYTVLEVQRHNRASRLRMWKEIEQDLASSLAQTNGTTSRSLDVAREAMNGFSKRYEALNRTFFLVTSGTQVVQTGEGRSTSEATLDQAGNALDVADAQAFDEIANEHKIKISALVTSREAHLGYIGQEKEKYVTSSRESFWRSCVIVYKYANRIIDVKREGGLEGVISGRQLIGALIARSEGGTYAEADINGGLRLGSVVEGAQGTRVKTNQAVEGSQTEAVTEWITIEMARINGNYRKQGFFPISGNLEAVPHPATNAPGLAPPPAPEKKQ